MEKTLRFAKEKVSMRPVYARLLCLLALWIGLGAAPLHAQNGSSNITIRGTVTGDDDQPLPGVNVRHKEGTASTQTDEKGTYALSLPGSGTLVFTFVGHKSEERYVESDGRIDLRLDGEIRSLEEVVAIGYGVAKKKDLTGSISTVSGEEVADRNMTQVSQALQGSMPGLIVTRSSTAPGAGASILIRGVTTIGNSTPLYIVDGVPVGNIDDVNADDIADISVLKDAASASIYGARAAAGVILITTKRPRLGQQSFQYTGTYGFEKPTAFPDMVGTRRYLEMMNEWTWNDAGNNPGGEYALFTQDDVENWIEYSKTNPNQYPNTDWMGLLLNNTAPRHSHYISFSSGSDKMRTMASINYEKIDALYDRRSYERVIARMNNSFTINKHLSAHVDMAYNYSLSEAPTLNPIWDAQRFAPIYAATWADGRIADGKNGSNAYAEMKYGGFNNDWRNKFYGRVALEFKPVDGLTITGVFSPQFAMSKTKTFTKQIRIYTADDPTVFSTFVAGHQATNLSEGRNDSKNFTKQLLANYTKKWNKHRFNALAGYEDYYSFNEGLGARANNYTLSNFPYLDLGPLDFMLNSGSASETAYRSYFGRLMYDFDNRYFIQANLRHDGSSRFHPDYRWGSFPSISAGWVISEENFMQNNRIFSHLKLRGSWGQLGNERIGNYPYQSSIGYSNTLFYQGGNPVSAITAAQFYYAIRDITWEITETSNIGVDMNFLNNRLSVSADLYRKKTRDMLLELEIPDYMGFENPNQNTGNMYTNGWDLQVGWRDRSREFKYSVLVNLSDSRTRMGNLGGIVLDGATIIREGSEFNEWYGYVSDGIFQTQDEVNNSPKLYNGVKPGDIRYRDISGPDGVPDGKITPDYDRVQLGGSLPRMLFSGQVNMEYKGFDFSLVFQGVGRQQSRLTSQMVMPFHSGWTNAPAIIDGKYWSVYNDEKQNQEAKYPRLSYTAQENNNYVNSDFWLIDGSYFRLKNLMIGYTLPQKWVRRARLQQVRLFASGSDLFSIDKLPRGWDPEANYSTYITSAYNFGVSIKF